jgi:hypothetical protein
VSINTRTITLTIFVILPLLLWVQVGDLLIRIDRVPIWELAKTYKSLLILENSLVPQKLGGVSKKNPRLPPTGEAWWLLGGRKPPGLYEWVYSRAESTSKATPPLRGPRPSARGAWPRLLAHGFNRESRSGKPALPATFPSALVHVK